jgi:hypothetical protein
MMALCDKAAEIIVIDDADSDPEQTQPSQPSHAPQLMADTDPEQSQPPQPSHAPQLMLMGKPDLLVTEAADSATSSASRMAEQRLASLADDTENSLASLDDDADENYLAFLMKRFTEVFK